MDAYRCTKCGEIAETPGSHKCKTTYEKVSLEPVEYCAKFDHRWQTVKEVPNSRKRFGRVEEVWENEEKYIEYERFTVVQQCWVCKSTRENNELKRLG